ncbi:MAG: hypothetical protein LBW85_09395 [Deltaproteobacteria bacterium]|nr:hypothetical protein [Deltaproteobacteria bacterium]
MACKALREIMARGSRMAACSGVTRKALRKFRAASRGMGRKGRMGRKARKARLTRLPKAVPSRREACSAASCGSAPGSRP